MKTKSKIADDLTFYLTEPKKLPTVEHTITTFFFFFFTNQKATKHKRKEESVVLCNNMDHCCPSLSSVCLSAHATVRSHLWFFGCVPCSVIF